jgi:hypothetical protein
MRPEAVADPGAQAPSEAGADRAQLAGGRARAAALAGGGLGVVLAAALLVAPPMGTDLSAQVAHADFAGRYGPTPIDLRWYGGVAQFGYSWISPWVMAVLGARATGAVAVVASAVLLGLVLARAGAARPVTAALLGAVTFAGNLVSGRVTYGLGVAFGLLALLILTARPTPGRAVPIGGRWWRATRLGLAGLAAALASATSPVAGVFVGLAGAALVLAAIHPARRAHPARSALAGWWRSEHLADGVALGSGAAVPLLVTALLASDGGVMNISDADALHAVVTGLVVAALVRTPVLRIGALLSSAFVAAAYLVPSPAGLNATRLATMFALPVIAGYALPSRQPAPSAASTGDRPRGRWRPRAPRYLRGWPLVGVILLAVWCWQPPVLTRDLADAGDPTASRAYFTPLLRELAQRRPTTRVEVPPTRDYWEAAYVAEAVPLARGWLRQVDTDRNPIFFEGGTDPGRLRAAIDPEGYRAWLLDNGVGYVALPDAELSWVARAEAAVLASRPGYLREVWRGEHWTLFAVDGAPSVVTGGSTVLLTGVDVVFDVATPGDVLVRVRPSRWLRVSGPAPAEVRPDGRWTVVRVSAPGRYTLSS